MGFLTVLMHRSALQLLRKRTKRPTFCRLANRFLCLCFKLPSFLLKFTSTSICLPDRKWNADSSEDVTGCSKSKSERWEVESNRLQSNREDYHDISNPHQGFCWYFLDTFPYPGHWFHDT